MNSNATASQRANPENPEGAKRNLASISPFFIVKDLQASSSHYIQRFGFQLDFQGPPDDVYYGHVSRDGIGIMLKTIPSRRASMSQPHPARMGSLGCLHLHPGPRRAVRRVQAAGCVVRERVVVHR